MNSGEYIPVFCHIDAYSPAPAADVAPTAAGRGRILIKMPGEY